MPQFALVPRSKHSGTGKILLFVLAALLVLCGGGGAVTYLLVKDDIKEVVAANETRVVVPDELMGRPRIIRPELQTFLDAGITRVKQSQTGITSTVAAAYGDPEKKDVVLVVAASRLTANPDKEIDSFVAGLTTSGVSGVTMISVDPGPLGGVAQCGDATATGVAGVAAVTMGVCVWVDRGSFGSVTMYFRTGSELQAEFPQIRAAVEQPG